MTTRRHSSLCLLLSLGAATAALPGCSSGTTSTSSADAGAPSATLSPSLVQLAALACNSTAAPQGQTFTIGNTGSGTLEWSAKLDNVVAFSISPSSGSVAAGKTATVTVTANPLAAGTAAGATVAGSVTVTSNDPNHPSVTLPVSATTQGAALSVTPGSLNFGLTSAGQAAPTQTLEVVNSGNADATVALASSSADFTVAPASVTVKAGSAASVTVTFKPATATAAPEEAQLVLSTSSPVCGALPGVISLVGQGTAGSVTYSPGTIDFGNVPCQGSSAAPSTFTVANTGNAPFTFTTSLGQGNASPFVLSTQGGVVAAGGSAVITVTPNPLPFPAVTTANAYGDTITLTTNVAGDMPHTVALKQTAAGAILAFSAPAAGLSAAAPLQIGTTSTSTVVTGSTTAGSWTITNTGNVATAVSFTQGPQSQVGAFVPPVTASVGTTTVPVTFAPKQVGPIGPVALSVLSTATDTNGNITALAGQEGVAPLCAPIVTTPSTNVSVNASFIAFDDPLSVWKSEEDTTVLGKNFGYLLGSLAQSFNVPQEFAFPLPSPTTKLVGSSNNTSLCLLSSAQSVSCAFSRTQPLNFVQQSFLGAVSDLEYQWDYGQYCALTSAGQVVCFNSNSNGAIQGLPTKGVSGFALTIGGSDQICWSDPNATPANEVSCGSFNGEGSTVGAPTDIGIATTGAPDAISGASGYACAIEAGATTVGCWGRNWNNDNLGNATNPSNATTAVTVQAVGGVAFPPAGSTVTKLVAGTENACAIVTTAAGASSLWCWGSDNNGQLATGPGKNANGSLAVQIAGITPTSVAVGQYSVGAVSGTQLYGWGENFVSEATGIGNPNECSQDVIYPVPYLSTSTVLPGETNTNCD